MFGLDTGGGGITGGNAGPAYSGVSPVFQIAANDPMSGLLGDNFMSGITGGSGTSTSSIVAISLLALAVGAGLAFAVKK